MTHLGDPVDDLQGVARTAYDLAFARSPVPTAVLTTGPGPVVADLNPALARLVGGTVDGLRGAPAGSLLHLEDLRVPVSRSGGSSGDRPRPVRLHQAGGIVLPVEVTVARTADDPSLAVLHVLPGGIGTAPLLDLAQELRNPMAGLLGCLEVLAEPGAAEDAGREDLLVAARRSAQRLAGLLEDVLTLGADGGSRLPGSTDDVDAVVSTATGTGVAASRLAARALTLTVRPLGTPAAVPLAPATLGRVVSALLDNATAYTPSGGQVEVAVTAGRTEVQVAVVDSGVGIPDDEQDLVFERFQRGSTATALRPTGAGLGLTVVRQVVEDCGGRVTVESTVGVGSRFTVLLPRLDTVGER